MSVILLPAFPTTSVLFLLIIISLVYIILNILSIVCLFFPKIFIVYIQERNVDMDSIIRIFGKRMRVLRKRKGLSQEQLAELCDLHPTYIGQLERGEKNASLETVMSVCKGLGTAPSELFENVAVNSLTPAQEIYSIVVGMSESQQKTVLEIVKNINSLIK